MKEIFLRNGQVAQLDVFDTKSFDWDGLILTETKFRFRINNRYCNFIFSIFVGGPDVFKMGIKPDNDIGYSEHRELIKQIVEDLGEDEVFDWLKDDMYPIVSKHLQDDELRHFQLKFLM